MENDTNIIKRVRAVLTVMLVMIGAVLGTTIPVHVRPDVMRNINIFLTAFVVGYFIGRIVQWLREDED